MLSKRFKYFLHILDEPVKVLFTSKCSVRRSLTLSNIVAQVKEMLTRFGAYGDLFEIQMLISACLKFRVGHDSYFVILCL